MKPLKFRAFRRIRQIFLFVLTFSAHALAAPDAGSLLEQQRQSERRPVAPTTLPHIVPESSKPATAARSQQRIKVKSFKLTGSITAFSVDELLALVHDLVGKELNLTELQAAAARIATHYREHGYFLANAYLPKQDITDGDITIAIQEGILDPAADGVRIQPAQGMKESNLRLDDTLAQNIVKDAVVPGEPLRQEALEHAILLLNDIPGISASANLEPGTTPGSTRIVLDMNEGPLLTTNVGVDNTGSRTTGMNRLSANANLSDINGMGDQIALSSNLSEIADNYYARLAYTLPMGINGLKFGLAYSHLAYTVGLELANSQARGSADTVTFSANYPLLRTRQASLRLNANLDHKNLYDEALGNAINRKRIDVVNLGLAWENFDTWIGGGLNQATLTVTAGQLDLGGVSSALNADQADKGPHANGNFSKTGYSFTRMQHGSEKLSFMISLNGQFPAKNLDSSEKIQFGGPYGVRAYPIGEASGDEGHKFSLEGRYLLFGNTVVGDVQSIAFVDIARVVLNHDASHLLMTLPNTYNIAGWGLGVVFGKPGKQDFRITFAQKIGDNPARNPTTGKDSDGSNDSSRFWLTANFYF